MATRFGWRGHLEVGTTVTFREDWEAANVRHVGTIVRMEEEGPALPKWRGPRSKPVYTVALHLECGTARVPRVLRMFGRIETVRRYDL